MNNTQDKVSLSCRPTLYDPLQTNFGEDEFDHQSS